MTSLKRTEKLCIEFSLSLKELMAVEVFSATKTDTSIAKIPSKIIVVTREDIRRRNYRYLWDVIEDLPGVAGYRRVQAEFGLETIAIEPHRDDVGELTGELSLRGTISGYWLEPEA